LLSLGDGIMSRPAIVLENVGKKYRIGRQPRARYLALRDVWMEALKASARRLWPGRNGLPPASDSEVWVLRDVCLKVQPGECLGIIGRNGAGKSTLLKLIGRITEPTAGCIRLRGRVASLLEVGTGFHPELTGRENIFLNGAILGMSRAEIRRKFDEIVAFAEVERFLDTPVKHYSSGMHMRLAFAVAAHLDAEIVLVDEVLAVGDLVFQKKCLGKMEQIGAQGRTVLFVSHALNAVQRLCPRVVLLADGRVVGDGAPAEVIRQYTSDEAICPNVRHWENPDHAPGDEVVRLRSVRVLDERGAVPETLDLHQPFWIEVVYEQLAVGARPAVWIQISNEQGLTLLTSSDFNNRDWWQASRRRGVVRSRCRIPGNFLRDGRYLVLAALWSYHPTRLHGIAPDAVSFQVIEATRGHVRGPHEGEWPGVIRPMLEWEVLYDTNHPAFRI
jgi:lipopolysaccharide transport system ATP-binding protein